MIRHLVFGGYEAHVLDVRVGGRVSGCLIGPVNQNVFLWLIRPVPTGRRRRRRDAMPPRLSKNTSFFERMLASLHTQDSEQMFFFWLVSLNLLKTVHWMEGQFYRNQYYKTYLRYVDLQIGNVKAYVPRCRSMANKWFLMSQPRPLLV